MKTLRSIKRLLIVFIFVTIYILSVRTFHLDIISGFIFAFVLGVVMAWYLYRN